MSGEIKAKLSACPSEKEVASCFEQLPPTRCCLPNIEDPVIEQKRTKEVKKATDSDDDICHNTDECRPYRMEPSFSRRIQDQKELVKKKYVIPKTPEQIKKAEKRKERLEKQINVCKYTVLKMPSPPCLQKIEKLKDADMKAQEKFPQKDSSFYGKLPKPPKKQDLELRKPKSGIVLNERPRVIKAPPVEEVKETDESISCYMDDIYCICGDEEEGEEIPSEGEKMQRRKVIAISRATSIETVKPEKKPSKECICEPCRPQIKKKDAPILKKKRKDPRFDFSFYYGSKLGSTFLDQNFGLCTPIIAYCYSHIKHPSKWTENTIDDILTMAQNFYKDLKIKKPTPKELPPYIILCAKKVKFEVSPPEVAGTVKSTDSKVYDLGKAVKLFFKKNSSGILQTIDHNIAFWKDKYYYLFDGSPRNNELYHCCKGAASLGHFYTLKEMMAVLIKRSNFGNSPFNIHSIVVTSVVDKNKPEPIEDIFHPVCDGSYGIIQASWDSGEHRFGFARNKQSLCISLIALLQSKISPASSWTKDTVDKIMVIGNRLHINLVKSGKHSDYQLDLDDIPGVLQVGAYWIELYIKPNCLLGCLEGDFTCCSVQKHLECHSTILLQIDRFHIAVWKQRGIFFMYDPFIRNCLGLKCPDGYGCLTVHNKLISLVDMIKKNFSSKCPIFRISSLKYCHITACPIDRCDCRKAVERINENVATPVCSKIRVARNVKDFEVDLNRKAEEELEIKPQKAELVIDLDSASLSETQIEPTKILTPTISGTGSEEKEADDEEWYGYCICDAEEEEEKRSEDEEGQYYYAKSVTTQVGSRSLLSSDEEESPIPKELLIPTLYEVPPPFSFAMQFAKDEKLSITASEEWRKESMFSELPDSTQILLGTKSLQDLEKNVEYAAPFACIMAIVVAKKFSVGTWTTEVVDYVLTCGVNLYQSSSARFDQVYKIEIPLITLGDDDFSVEVEYCLDAVIGSKILEQTLSRMLPTPAIFVSPCYSCAIVEKHHLYYLFDCFPSNKVGFGDTIGTAYLARFKDLRCLIHRLLHNKKQRELGEDYFFDRFVLSCCYVKAPDFDEIFGMEEDAEIVDIIDIPQPKIIKGYQEIDGINKITGTLNAEINPFHPGSLGSDFFICILSCLKLFNHRVDTWDNLMVDQVVKQGIKMAEHAGSISIGEKLTVRNVLVDGYFFDFVIRTVKHFERALKMDFLLVQNEKQFTLVHRTNTIYHIFDPCASPAGWTKIEDYNSFIRGLKKLLWLAFQITSFRKAPRYLQENRLIEEKKPPPERYDKPFYEDPTWLELEPIPWSPKLKVPKCRWFNWYEIYSNDLYVIWGSIHQKDLEFGDRATLANIMVAEAFVETYPLDQWSRTLIDSILEYGQILFQDVTKKIKQQNYDINWDDFKQLTVPPYIYDFKYQPVVDGTMFLVHPNSFNLYKALRYFFENRNRRMGVLTRSYKRAAKKFLLFGKTGVGSYFMYDCQTFCLPLFRENEGVSYILKATSLNRLLHVMVLTLKGGDFFISEVKTEKTYI